MGKRLLVPVTTFILAFGVLFASILQSSAVTEVFSQEPTEMDLSIPEVDYQLPGTGAIGPEDLLWMGEVLRDKVWLATTLDVTEKSELLLLLADKRIAYAQALAERGAFEEAIVVSRKAEMYLVDAVKTAKNIENHADMDHELCVTLANASLKHREILERIYSIAPDDARPVINEINDMAKWSYEHTSHMLHEFNLSSPTNPFN